MCLSLIYKCPIYYIAYVIGTWYVIYMSIKEILFSLENIVMAILEL